MNRQVFKRWCSGYLRRIVLQFHLLIKMNIIRDEDFEEALGSSLNGEFHKDFQYLHAAKRRKENVHLSAATSQRDRERQLRETLKSRHGPTAEVHDQVDNHYFPNVLYTFIYFFKQFYRDHKLLLVLFRALAVMPIERSSPGKVTFSWNSWASIYAFLFYCCATVIVVIVGRERIEILANTKKFDESIYGILFIIFLIPHFWIPFVG